MEFRNTNNHNNTQKGALNIRPSVIVAIVTCLFMALCFLFPWVSERGKSYSMLSAEFAKDDVEIINTLAIISMLCYFGAAVLFLLKRPKLSLLPSIIGFILFMFLFILVVSAVNDTSGAKLAAWPVIQLFLGILAFIMVGVCKKKA